MKKRISMLMAFVTAVSVLLCSNALVVHAKQRCEVYSNGRSSMRYEYNNVEKNYTRYGNGRTYNTASKYDLTVTHNSRMWSDEIVLGGTSSVMMYDGYFDSASITANVVVQGLGELTLGGDTSATTSKDTISDIGVLNSYARSYKTELSGRGYMWIPLSWDVYVVAEYNIGGVTFKDNY